MNIFELSKVKPGKLIGGFEVLGSSTDPLRRYKERRITFNLKGWKNIKGIEQAVIYRIPDNCLNPNYKIVDSTELVNIDKVSLMENYGNCITNNKILLRDINDDVTYMQTEKISKKDSIGLLIGKHILFYGEYGFYTKDSLTLYSQILLKEKLAWICHKVDIDHLSLPLEVQ